MDYVEKYIAIYKRKKKRYLTVGIVRVVEIPFEVLKIYKYITHKISCHGLYFAKKLPPVKSLL